MGQHRNPDGDLAELADIHARFKRFTANRDKLDACPWHEFEQIPRQPLPPGMMSTEHPRYRCKHCGGVLDEDAYHWHEQGRRARP